MKEKYFKSTTEYIVSLIKNVAIPFFNDLEAQGADEIS